MGGEATHLFAVDPRKIKSGEVPIEEVPYMQRAGGAWDGSDLKGAALRRAKKKQSQGMYMAGKWLDSDCEYEQNGPGVMSFFTQFNGGKQEKVEDRARQKASRRTRSSGATPALCRRSRPRRSRRRSSASRRRSSACSRSPCLYPVVCVASARRRTSD